MFRFYPADRVEPPHVHVLGNDGFAKIWLEPRLRFEHARGYSEGQISRVTEIAEAHRDEWLARWREFFRHA